MNSLETLFGLKIVVSDSIPDGVTYLINDNQYGVSRDMYAKIKNGEISRLPIVKNGVILKSRYDLAKEFHE